MKICLIAAFPPSMRQLNEYSYHIAREIQRRKDIELTILADELDESPAADGQKNGFHAEQQQELPDPGAPAQDHSTREPRCGVVQPGVFELWHA
jgi:hypothetical protein